MNRSRIIIFIVLAIASVSLAVLAQQNSQVPAVSEAKPNPGQNVARPEGAMPKVPAGFTVDIYADNLPGARIMEWAPNGDLFVAQTAGNAVGILRDTNKDGVPEERFTFVQGAAAGGGRGGRGAPAGAAPAAANPEVVQPFGLAFQNGYLYVG